MNKSCHFTGDSVVVGGAVPAKGGRPKIKLSKYKVCPPEYRTDENASDDDGGEAATELSEEEITGGGEVKPKGKRLRF